MENALSKSQKLTSQNNKNLFKSKSFKSKTLNLLINNNSSRNNKFRQNSNNNNLAKLHTISKSINIEDNLKRSNSTFKGKNNEFFKQKISSSIMSKNTKSNKNINADFDFMKFDSQALAYNIDKDLCKSLNFRGESFLNRMQKDIKKRQTKEEKRNNLLNEYKPKDKEEERIKCFNRLINDSNKRNKIKQNIERQSEFLSSGITPKKMSKKRWDIIYENRFYNYQEKIDNNLREKIIENEKIIKQKEEEIIEQINSSTKKVSKKELDKIVNRLYYDSKKKELNKKLENIVSSDKDNKDNKDNKDKDKANGMKKEEKNEDELNNINSYLDNNNLTRTQKQHYTIKSTKLREKKNSYFGSVIIKTSTFEQGKTNSLIKFIQNIGKSDNKLEKRHTIQTVQKEIKEIENENMNISGLNKSNISNNNDIDTKEDKEDKCQKLKSISNIWANDIQIKKSKSLKRILVNDFNSQNMKFNINSNYKNKNINEKKNKKVNNGLNIINSEYYKNIDEDENSSDSKINEINLNEFIINDLKNNMNGNNKLNENRHFNSPRSKSNYKNYYKNNIYNNNNINKKTIIFNEKNIKANKNNKKNSNNNKRYIDELSAMKLVENIFVSKIKDK